MKKVLVTGGTGFLGAYIIKELVEKGFAVRAIRRSGSTLPAYIAAAIFDKVEWVDGDILDVVALEEAMEDVYGIIHSAAVVSFSKKDRKQMYHTNVEGTANVVNIALEKNVQRFAYISSVAALGRTAKGTFVNEDRKWEESKVNTHYAKSKHKAELEVWRGMGEGLDAVILNPSTILGYGNWHNSSSGIFKKVYDGFTWYTPGINGFVAVEDVARAAVLLMDSDITEQRFIINGDNWPFKQLQETIADGFGKKRPAKEASPLLMGIAWRLSNVVSFFTGKKSILTKESARVAFSKTHFSNDKIKNTLPGFSFTPLDDAITAACKKYLNEIKNK